MFSFSFSFFFFDSLNEDASVVADKFMIQSTVALRIPRWNTF